MPQNIFGTDGVRGVANADLSCDLAFRLGRAATKFLGPDICIGRDTRLSGTMLESALTAGIMAEGGRPHCCGVIPTPAVALLTVQNELDGGIVISASHNPPEFNGIKFFSRKGMKLPDAVEEEISAWVMSEEAMAADTLPTGAGVGHIIKMKDARKAYVDHAISTLDGLKLDGLVVAVDCGHGASCQTTPAALQRLGATVHAINTDYCGTDINVECGSTHLEPLRELVLRTHADIGLAHDGDADRGFRGFNKDFRIVAQLQAVFLIERAAENRGKDAQQPGAHRGHAGRHGRRIGRRHALQRGVPLHGIENRGQGDRLQRVRAGSAQWQDLGLGRA